MKKILAASIGLLALSGCYSQEQYTDDYYRVTCDKTFECYDADTLELFGYGADADECYEYFQSLTADSEGDGESDCDFQSGEAQTCIADLEALSCDDYMAASFPEACSAVCG